MLEGIKTDHKCPECGEKLQFDVVESFDNYIIVNIYCTSDTCEHYDWRFIDPIVKEIQDAE